MEVSVRNVFCITAVFLIGSKFFAIYSKCRSIKYMKGSICKCIFNSVDTALTVSSMMHGEYGVDDVCLSTLALVDNTGVRGKILNKLTDEETARLQNSANKLKEVIHQITY